MLPRIHLKAHTSSKVSENGPAQHAALNHAQAGEVGLRAPLTVRYLRTGKMNASAFFTTSSTLTVPWCRFWPSQVCAQWCVAMACSRSFGSLR